MPIYVRPMGPEDRESVTRVLQGSWGGTEVVALGLGEVVDALEQQGFVAFDGATLAGVVTYARRKETVEIITVDAVVEGSGVGRLLLDAVRTTAKGLGVSRLRVVTTNDNVGALRFYQRYGFDLVGLRRGAIDELRGRLKAEIPAESDGIAIRHELELELRLG